MWGVIAIMKVEVYRNLHKQCWSVRSNETGRVIDHVRNIHLKDATLVVRPSGREKVLRERKKNVHAFVRGEITNVGGVSLTIDEVVYNPYKNTTFIEKVSGEPIHYADDVYLTNLGNVYVKKHRIEVFQSYINGWE
jgi:hypothetical protein|tara:strand:+ start:414 stop:821 length:408 start_codon:yes stop_codon:yes gene_type:complete